jgi:O-antigen/teichoic acid export membrane protein
LPLYARLAGDLVALRRAFRTLATGLAVVLVPAYGVLAAAAVGIARELLDPRWTGAAPVIRVIAVACMLGIVGEAAVPLFQGLGLSRLVVALEIAQLVVVTVLAGLLTGALGTTGAAFAWLAAVGASLVLTRALLHRILGRAPDQRHRIGVIAGSGAVAAVVTLAVPLLLDGLAGVVAGVAAGVAAAAIVIWRTDRSWRLEIGADLRTLFPGSS